MKQTVMGLLSLVALSIAIPAAARDDRLKFPVDAALAKGQNYKEKLDPQIKLYFGKPSKLKVAMPRLRKSISLVTVSSLVESSPASRITHGTGRGAPSGSRR